MSLQTRIKPYRHPSLAKIGALIDTFSRHIISATNESPSLSSNIDWILNGSFAISSPSSATSDTISLGFPRVARAEP